MCQFKLFGGFEEETDADFFRKLQTRHTVTLARRSAAHSAEVALGYVGRFNAQARSRYPP